MIVWCTCVCVCISACGCKWTNYGCVCLSVLLCVSKLPVYRIWQLSACAQYVPVCTTFLDLHVACNDAMAMVTHGNGPAPHATMEGIRTPPPTTHMCPWCLDTVFMFKIFSIKIKEFRGESKYDFRTVSVQWTLRGWGWGIGAGR